MKAHHVLGSLASAPRGPRAPFSMALDETALGVLCKAFGSLFKRDVRNQVRV